jgi:hypothetical protein
MKVASTILLLSAAVAVSLSLASCGEEDLTSVKFTVEAGGKGKMVSTIIRVKDVKDSALSKSASGVTWKGRELAVVVQEATFDDISRVQIAGIKPSVSGNLFRLTVPLGKAAEWTKVLAASKDDIDAINKLNKEQGLAIPAGVGTSFKFTVRLPGNIIAKGCTPKIAEESSGGMFSLGSEEEGKEATLVIPLKKVKESKEKELIWEVTWKE